MGIVSGLLWGAARIGIGIFELLFADDQPALREEFCSSPPTAEMPSSANGLLLPVWAIVLSVLVSIFMGAMTTVGAYVLGRRSATHQVICTVCGSTFVRQ